MRQHNKEFKQFLFIALGRGSSAELETQLIIADKMKYLSVGSLDRSVKKLIILNKRIMALVKSL